MNIPRYLVGISAASCLLFASSSFAATSAARAQYEKQRAECMSGKSNEDKATCLKEAGAALDEAKRGQLNDGDASFRKNQIDRCKALSGGDKADCIARMKGAGTVSGSAEGGGIIREKTTTTVSPGSITVAPAASGTN